MMTMTIKKNISLFVTLRFKTFHEFLPNWCWFHRKDEKLTPMLMTMVMTIIIMKMMMMITFDEEGGVSAQCLFHCTFSPASKYFSQDSKLADFSILKIRFLCFNPITSNDVQLTGSRKSYFIAFQLRQFFKKSNHHCCNWFPSLLLIVTVNCNCYYVDRHLNYHGVPFRRPIGQLERRRKTWARPSSSTLDSFHTGISNYFFTRL